MSRFASRFACFLDLRVTQLCKGEKERGASNIGNFCNKNKHNISPMIIVMPPVFLAFSPPPIPLTHPPPPIPTASTISIVMLWPHPPVATKAAPPKIQHKSRCCFMATVARKSSIFSQKQISLANREHLRSPSMR